MRTTLIPVPSCSSQPLVCNSVLVACGPGISRGTEGGISRGTESVSIYTGQKFSSEATLQSHSFCRHSFTYAVSKPNKMIGPPG